MFKHTSAILDECYRLGVPGTDLCIYHKGNEVFRSQRGAGDENGTPMTGKEKFNAYSCSKVITCTAAMMLVQEGKLGLYDELAAYLPEFGDMLVNQAGTLVKAERQITIFQLFTMTAGLGYDADHEAIKRGQLETDGLAPTVDMMKYIAQIPLEYEPGTTWNYSFCHDVLAAVIEVVSGMRFGDFLRERIFTPLKMENTTFCIPDSELSTLMPQYRAANGTICAIGNKLVAYRLGSQFESGGAGAVSTVDDFIKFSEGLRTGRLLNEDSMALMIQDHLRDDQRATYWGSVGYGYGLGVRTPKNNRLPRTDFGWAGAAGSFLAIDPKNEISLYCAQHILSSPSAGHRKDIIEAAKLDLGYSAFTEDMWNGVFKSTLA